jgi:hypothetical protein
MRLPWRGESSGLPEDFSQGLLAGSVYQGNDMTMKNNFPKILAAVLAGCFVASVQAQEDVPTEAPRFRETEITFDPATGEPRAAVRQETRFDLNFKGGTPKQFIEAINAQSGLKVNVIIPAEEAEAQLPSVEMFNVTIPQLFAALTAANTKQTNYLAPGMINRGAGSTTHRGPSWTTIEIGLGFATTDKPPREDSIWSFFVSRPPAKGPLYIDVGPPTVKVYQVAQTLTEHSIDDITTAIKTTWQLLESTIVPELKYHSDTGLLMVKGAQEHVEIVADVLRQLRPAEGGSASSSATRLPLPPTAGQP